MQQEAEEQQGGSSPPRDANASRIRPIPRDSVRQIVAGQVIFDLASAVKELVDNSLDAGSTSINVRLFNQGLDIIEVSDNGSGIPAASRPLLAMPHATSKLASWDDLYHNNNNNNNNLSSFTPRTLLGFRGEALYALSTLCQSLVVLTRAAQDELAQKITIARQQQQQQPHDANTDTSTTTTTTTTSTSTTNNEWAPRKVGTTVAAVRLFDALPVRRIDFQRRLPAQRQRLVRLLQHYAVLCGVGVQFHVMEYNHHHHQYPTNNNDNATLRETTVLQTPPRTTQLAQTITAILGVPFFQRVTPIDIDLTDWVAAACTTTTTTRKSDEESKHPHPHPHPQQSPDQDSPTRHTTKWQIQGYLSKPLATMDSTTTSSSNSNNRCNSPQQMFALNKRPVDLPKVTRLLNDLWREHTAGWSTKNKLPKYATTPSCIWQFTVPNHLFDINVAADKRTVQWTAETQLLEVIQNAVQKAWNVNGQFNRAPNLTTTLSSTTANTTTTTATPTAVPKASTTFVAAATAADSDDDEDDLDEDDEAALLEAATAFQTSPSPERRRFNRRYAFSHDIKNIRLQHEFDDGRKRRYTEPQDNKKEPPVSQKRPYWSLDEKLNDSDNEDHDDDDDDGTSPSKRPHIDPSANLETPPHTRDGPVATKETATTATTTDETKAQSLHPRRATLSVSVTDSDEAPSFPNVTPSPAMATNPSLAEQRLWRHAREKFNSGSTTLLVNNNDDDDDESEHDDDENIFNADEISDDDDEGEPSRDQHSTAQRRREFLNQFGSNTATSSSSRSTTVDCLADRTHRLERFGFRSDTIPKPPRETTGTQSGERSRSTVELNHLMPTRKACSSPTAATKVQEEAKRLANDDNTREAEWQGFGSTAQVTQAATAERLRMYERKRKLKDTANNADENTSKIVSLTKTDFANLEIIGQFNLGFIIAKTRDNHLYILDQHACDEKYNFEKLCRETIIHEQRLIAPMPLELSPTEEACILEHTDIFEKNGFRFKYDPNKPPRHRFALIGLPHSGASDGRKAVQFGKDDVSALCAILSGEESHAEFLGGGGTGADGSGLYGNNAVRRYAGRSGGDSADRVIARLPKAVAMFASRACRSSIMIGKALSSQEMDQIVKKLEHVEHPWNCPHGRPTMRHLGDLTSVLAEDERKTAEAIGNATVTILSQEELN